MSSYNATNTRPCSKCTSRDQTTQHVQLPASYEFVAIPLITVLATSLIRVGIQLYIGISTCKDIKSQYKIIHNHLAWTFTQPVFALNELKYEIFRQWMEHDDLIASESHIKFHIYSKTHVSWTTLAFYFCIDYFLSTYLPIVERQNKIYITKLLLWITDASDLSAAFYLRSMVIGKSFVLTQTR